jgi:hypothetical protein
MTSQAQAKAPLENVRGLAFLGFPLHPAGRPSHDRAEHLFDVKIPMLFIQGTRWHRSTNFDRFAKSLASLQRSKCLRTPSAECRSRSLALPDPISMTTLTLIVRVVPAIKAERGREGSRSSYGG